VPAGFTRASPESPLWTLDGAPAAVIACFRPFDPAAVPATLPLAATLDAANAGTYVFLPPGTALADPLPAALAAFVAAQPRPPAFAWIPAPGDPPATWRASTIARSGVATAGAAGVLLRNLALWVGAGCAIAVDAAGDALVLTPPAAGRIYLTGAAGAASWSTGAAPLTVPFAGPRAGCLTTAITLDSATDLDRLDVGLRLFAPGAPTALLRDRLASWRLPVFAAAPGGEVPVQLSLDPLSPTVPARTAFGLAPATGATAPELGSCYVTTTGLAVTLTPLADPPAALVPAVRALAADAGPMDPFYLVPSGAFALTVRDEHGNAVTGAQRLACGTSGLEYVTLDQPGSTVVFTPDGDALAIGRGLQGGATTAYASLFGPDGTALTYRAQPESAPVFAPPDASGYLDFYELAGQPLPAASAPPAVFPMLPFAGVAPRDAAAAAAVERAAVAPRRRSLVGAAAPVGAARPDAAVATATTVGATPQGLLGEFGDGVLSALDLLQSNGQAIRLGAVSDPLREALQSSQLFLVVSDPAALQGPSPPAADWTIRIPATDDRSEWWTLQAGLTGAWKDTGTLLIVKHAGTALEALAADTTAWTQPTDFNTNQDGVADAQRTLRDAIAKAREQVDAHPAFQPFLDLVADASWQGLLILNCAMPVADLPSQLAGLGAGIQQDGFKAHHIGLTITPVAHDGQGALVQTDSSLFGLLFYESPQSAAGAPGPYAFSVRSLLVRWANSAVADFSSVIDLLVDELFGDPVQLTRSKDNVIELYGVYQQQGGDSTYTFTTREDSMFGATSGVLSAVDVAGAQFVTVTPPGPQATAESTFLLSGSLRYVPPKVAFDLFSYGPPPEPQPDDAGWRLAFANLRIEIRYTPGDPTKNQYLFDATKLALDPAQSAPRAGSLFASFPLTPSGFVHVPEPVPAAGGGDAKPPAPATPASLGFLGVDAPQAGGALDAPWFGVVADLGLGTAGALASQLGFRASLLASWAPGSPSSPNVAVGLKLPGSGGGGSLLSLESVLKLKIGALAMQRSDGTYVLALDRISLSVLMLTFPSHGQIGASLFADPTGKDHTTLGWYAAYAKDKDKDPQR